MNTDDYKVVTAGVKGGEKLVLGFIALYAEEGKKVDSHALAEDTGLSVKQIVRLTAKLKEAGRVNIEGGVGRAPYVFSLASANQDKMSAQRSEEEMSEQDIKSSQEVVSEDKMSPLADAGTKSPDNEIGSADKKSGTEVAPLSAETTKKTISLANARESRAKTKQESIELPEWLSPETWGEWVQFNKERRKPLPPTTVKAQLRQLAEFRARGMPPEAVIAQSISRNWQGLFEVKEQNSHAQSGAHRNGDRPRKPGLAERARATAEHFGLGRTAKGSG